MLKLVTQFDEPTQRVSAATPTCGCCCCCCCCCVLTSVASGVVTSLNLRSGDGPKPLTPRVVWTRRVLAFLAVPFALVTGGYAISLFGNGSNSLWEKAGMITLALLTPVLWFGYQSLLFRNVRHRHPTKALALYSLLIVVGAAVEVYLGAVVCNKLDSHMPVVMTLYVLFAIGMGFTLWFLLSKPKTR